VENKKNIKNDAEVYSDGLFDGNLGFSLRLFYDYLLSSNDKSYDCAMSILDDVFESLQNESTLANLSISEGLSGLGYMLCLLNNLDLLDVEVEEIIPGLDGLLYELAAESVRDGNLGFCNGVSGVLHYFNKTQAGELTAGLVGLVMSVTTNDKKEFFYPAEPIFLPRLGVTHSYVNLSMSNGLSGLISTLLNYYHAHPSPELKMYIYDALNFILANRREVSFAEGRFCHFPSFVKDPGFDYGQLFKAWDKSRLAWCIGDLNMAYLFTRAGQLFNEEEFLAVGNETGLTTTKRKYGLETKVTDPFFCHGSSGLAAVYRRLYEMTSLEHYRESHAHWSRMTESYVKKGSLSDQSRGGLLNGSAGAELFLATQSIDNADNNWTSLFIP
jgi:lantibiotic modifying enzyme